MRFRRRRSEQELDDELRYHIERQVEHNIAAGMSPDEARRAAMVAFAGLEQRKEECRDTWRRSVLDHLAQDLRYALRSLWQAPGFAVVAIVTLALGIGATSAIFSIVEASLLRTLPFPDPDRLVSIESINPSRDSRNRQVSPADFRDWASQAIAFEQIAAYSGTGFTLRDNGDPENIAGSRVTANFFDVLKVRPAIGRTFNTEETSIKGPRAIILSHGLWQRRFGGNPNIVGERLSTGETVIGVMPPEFNFPRSTTEAWVPIFRDTPEVDRRSARYWSAFGRLRPGETVTTARAQMKTIADRLAIANPKDDQNWLVQVQPLAAALVENFRTPLLILMSAVGVVLLIAYANVAGLVLVRTSARRQEILVRLALGANRSRLLRQFVVEGVVLSLFAAAFGTALAKWTIDGLFFLVPSTSLAALASVRDNSQSNGIVLLFNGAVAIIAGLCFSLIPTLSSIRASAGQPSLQRSNRASQTRREHRFHKVLVVAQFASAVVLLTAAGLLIQSFIRMSRGKLWIRSSRFDPDESSAASPKHTVVQ